MRQFAQFSRLNYKRRHDIHQFSKRTYPYPFFNKTTLHESHIYRFLHFNNPDSSQYTHISTCGNKAAGASSLFNCDSMAFTFSSQLYESNNSTDAFATAQANGFPIKRRAVHKRLPDNRRKLYQPHHHWQGQQRKSCIHRSVPCLCT